MAENKKSFILYADLISTVRKMDKERAGMLFMTILSYVNDENPEVEDSLVDLVFEPIKQQLKRDLVKYEEKRKKLAENASAGGKKSAELRQANRKQNEAIASKSEANLSNCKQIERVNDNVTVNVNDTVNDIFNNMPTADEILELPEIKINSAIQLIKITKGQDVAAEKITGMWEVFKTQNLTGKKYYPDVGAIHSHFINWIKTQKFETNASGKAKTRFEITTGGIVDN